MADVLLDEKHDHLRAGQQALAQGAWDQARARFEAALGTGESAEALEGLGTAAWWLSDVATVFAARERAYRLYRRRRDDRGAARVAAALAMDYCTFRGQAVLAGGWVRRAERVLGGAPCPELGWLLIAKAHMALMIEHEPSAARAVADEARSLGRDLANIDLEMLALAYEGLALVSIGKVAEGMRCLDEATVAAVTGEMGDIDATCTACCCLILACEKTRDLERAAQWCAQLEELARRASYRLMFALCRTHYAGVLIWRGAWEGAENVLVEAIDELERTHRAQGAEALVTLAGLRWRQGRLGEAEALYERAEAHPFRMLANEKCLLGRAAMALDGGDAESALDLAGRFMRAVPAEAQLERAAGLELLVHAHAALGDRARACAALDELRRVAATAATSAMQAALRFGEGLVAAAADPSSAKPCLEDALELWARGGAPYEAARVRIELGRVLFRIGRRAAAVKEVRAAARALHSLGAMRAASRAHALLREIERAGVAASGAPLPAPLTSREFEILGLVAQGLTNKRIATRLGRSEHTVHRHIANILTKLGLPSRAAAVSYAAKHGLV